MVGTIICSHCRIVETPVLLNILLFICTTAGEEKKCFWQPEKSLAHILLLFLSSQLVWSRKRNNLKLKAKKKTSQSEADKP